MSRSDEWKEYKIFKFTPISFSHNQLFSRLDSTLIIPFITFLTQLNSLLTSLMISVRVRMGKYYEITWKISANSQFSQSSEMIWLSPLTIFSHTELFAELPYIITFLFTDFTLFRLCKFKNMLLSGLKLFFLFILFCDRTFSFLSDDRLACLLVEIN